MPQPAPVVHVPTTWTFHYSPGTYRYTVSTQATIALTSDTATQQAPVTTLASYQLTLTPSSDSTLNVAGVVDSFAVSRGTVIPTPAADGATQLSSVPFNATITTTGTVLGFESPARTECDSVLSADSALAPADSALSPAIATARELLVPVPSSFTDSTAWQDSTRTTSCRDGIPVTTVALQHYHVAGQTTYDSTTAVQVERTSTFTVSGSGTPRYRTDGTFQVAGTGTSSATLYLDPRSGVLLGGSTTGTADITVTTAQGQLPFHQEVTQTISRQP